MRFTRFLMLCACATSFAFGGRVGSYATTASSTFDLNSEGWTVVNNGGSVNPDYHATGGNPGGYISATDAANGPVFYFSAPSIFLGNQSALAGGSLRFDLMTTPGDFVGAPDVILTGGGLTLVALVKGIADVPNAFWTSEVIFAALDNNTTWAVGDTNGPTPTPEQFLTALSSLTSLQIRGEYVDGTNTGSLDNVSLNAAPASVPEPATFAAVGVVLCVLCAVHQKKRSA